MAMFVRGYLAATASMAFASRSMVARVPLQPKVIIAGLPCIAWAHAS